jgi:sigma-B regulation protein RsbU (phosphoserine phosphatase)
MGWNAFRAAVLLKLAKIVHQPHGGGPAAVPGGTLPDAPGYHSDAFSRPYTRVGNHFFGGDWYAGHTPDDGSLWVIVADVTGHGYFAYLVASVLPGVWQRCWSEQPEHACEPAELLAAMHDLLSDCLPEGIFLECTLVRLDEAGRATVSPAGGSRLLLGRQRRAVDLVKLRGAWLGLRAPTAAEQHTLELGHGDELILATDGVFDQLDDDGGIPAVLDELPGVSRTLFEALRDRLQRCLECAPQKDDITLVLLRRREPADVGRAVLPLPGARLGVDDVPV